MQTPAWFDTYLQRRRDELAGLDFGVMANVIVLGDSRAVRSAITKLIRGEYVDDHRLRALEEAARCTFDNSRAERLEREFAAAVLLMLAATGWSDRHAQGAMYVHEALGALDHSDPEIRAVRLAAAKDVAGLA